MVQMCWAVCRMALILAVKASGSNKTAGHQP